MKITRYKCSGRDEDSWDFTEVEFGKINLLVGDTATGKTRLLNTIFNIGSFVASDQFKSGYWDISFMLFDTQYRWVIKSGKREANGDQRILEERLIRYNEGSEDEIIIRSPTQFIYNGQSLPKLSPNTTSFSLLKEEEGISQIYKGFTNIRRRRFFDDVLQNISTILPIPPNILQGFEQNKSLDYLYKSKLHLNANLYVISKIFPELFDSLRNQLKIAFPFIAKAAVRELSQVSPNLQLGAEVPVFCIRERRSERWIPLHELSSGMQKVILILSDVLTLPDGSIYIIDEYENSLGISAIDFFPEFVLDLEKEIQFFVTSHHPYIINAIPPSNWYVFHRKGTQVSIQHGDELTEKFGKSRQKAFIQLLNDPFYTKGVE